MLVRLLAARSYVLLGLATLPLTFCDLPVHCLRHQVLGEWRFTLGALREERSSCGHRRPDAEDVQPSRSVVDADQKRDGIDDTRLMLTFDEPNIVATARDPHGTWTMIYDEGFELNVAGLNFFAFSNFTFVNNASETDPRLKKQNVSHCGYTMVGWYQNMDRTRFGCYYAEKVVQDEDTSQSGTAPKSVVALSARKQTKLALGSEAAAAAKAAYEKTLDHHTQERVVSKLTERLSVMQLGWKARTIQKWNGRTMREVNSYAGLKRPVQTHKEMLKQHATARQQQLQQESSTQPRSFLQRNLRHRRGPEQRVGAEAAASDGLPAAFDWSDVGGRDFLEQVMDQADCGSCYAASSMRMLTARHKIKQNDTEVLPWSINFPLTCSEFNQGCQGGYGILVAKFSRDVGLLPATCMRYNTGGSCKLECDLKSLQGQKRFRATRHRYVGSWYGNSSVEAIKAELVSGGPLVLGLEPSEDFMWYSEGIYKSPTKKKSLLHDAADHEWERVDHAVLLVGYGEENGKKYWRLQNSWGPDWGEDGFFRIAMGENEAAIESIAEAADVVEDEQDGRQVDAFFNQVANHKA